MRTKPIIAITMGDPGGIGPEVTLKALARLLLKPSSKKAFYVLIGSRKIFEKTKKICKIRIGFNILPALDRKLLKAGKANLLDIEPAFPPDKLKSGRIRLVPDVGVISRNNADLAHTSLKIGAYLAAFDIADALVTAPLSKEAIRLIRPGFTGHTEYLAEISRTKKFAMMFVGDRLRVSLVTTHLPLKDVSKAIKKETVFDKIVLTHDFLKKYLRIKRPNIAVAALNPHGGEFGKEEPKIIRPAVIRAQKRKIKVSGPFPADQLFHYAYRGEYDAVVAMYHDQALCPFKMTAFNSGVNTTLGLPFIRTSPDHGTAFNIAYKNKADCQSMFNAIKLATECCL